MSIGKYNLIRSTSSLPLEPSDFISLSKYLERWEHKSLGHAQGTQFFLSHSNVLNQQWRKCKNKSENKKIAQIPCSFTSQGNITAISGNQVGTCFLQGDGQIRDRHSTVIGDAWIRGSSQTSAIVNTIIAASVYWMFIICQVLC